MPGKLAKNLKIRAAHRLHTRKVLASVDELLMDYDGSDTTKDKIKRITITLNEKLATLKALDESILAAIDEGNLEPEIEESEEFRARIHGALVKLQKCENSPGKQESPQGSQGGSVPSSSSNGAKLPKLHIKRFAGDPKNWQTFWDSFSSAVHKNASLTNVDKFNYLRSLLDGPALNSITGLPLTELNYKEAIEILTDRFGNKQIIISSHMETLLKLQPVNAMSNVKGIRAVLDNLEIQVRGLQALGIDSAQYGALLIPIFMEKLPEELRLIVSREHKDNWELTSVIKAVKNEVEARERCGMNTSVEKKSPLKKSFNPGNESTASALLSGNRGELNCLFCRGNHRASECQVVTNIDERREILKKQGRCFNCLRRGGHLARNCDTKIQCFKCSGRHHLAVCNSSMTDSSNIPAGATASPALHIGSGMHVFLQTAQVNVSIPGKELSHSLTVRAIFDTGAQRSYINQKVVNALKLKTVRTERLKIATFGDQNQELEAVNLVELSLTKSGTDFKTTLNAFAVPHICNDLQGQDLEWVKKRYPSLKNIEFADVCPASNTMQIDLLIGSDYIWDFFDGKSVRGEESGQGGPVAVSTKVGWVLSGPVENLPREKLSSIQFSSTHVLRTESRVVDDTLQGDLDRLWDLDSVGIRDKDTVLEAFEKNLSFEDGKYLVHLPWKEQHGLLPDNFENCVARLSSQLKRLRKDPEILEEYDSIIQDQLQSGIIEQVDCAKRPDVGRVHYLPHHGVVRRDALTTKLRVVFDASSRPSSDSPSLNECLYSGPALTPTIFNVLLRFREKRIALVGDIEKAFLNVGVAEEDRDVLRFLWVDSLEEENPGLMLYRFCRVVFGVNASPFLLNATLKYHISQYEADPGLVQNLLNSFYVDDLVTGERGVEECLSLYQKSKKCLLEGGFNLRKWISNSPKLLELICEDQVGTVGTCAVVEDTESYAKTTVNHLEKLDMKDEHKVLGLNWNCVTDEFIFKFEALLRLSEDLEPTRRNLLKVTSSFFDPLGVLSPILVEMKILFQSLCQDKFEWDAPLPESARKQWNRWLQDLREVQQVLVPRCVYAGLEEGVTSHVIHGFGDASEKAYCAVVYLVLEVSGDFFPVLLSSKTRVAPLTRQSIPRLELLSGVILARLVSSVKEALASQITIDKTHLWLDSKTAICWIKGSKEWKQFVQNRVNEILSLTEESMWNHCPGIENPADIGSRGEGAVKLKSNVLWWKGPSWLSEPMRNWPSSEEHSETIAEECCVEMKKGQAIEAVGEAVLLTTNGMPNMDTIIPITDFSSCDKLFRITALVLRFVKNLKIKAKLLKEGTVYMGEVTAEELGNAEVKWLRSVQKELKSQANYSQLERDFGLYEDSSGVLRCKGRIANADVPHETKFPALLPRNHYLSTLLVRDAHEGVHHNRVEATLAQLRTRFWIVKGRQFVKRTLASCTVCRRYEGKSYRVPPQSDLPEFRLSQKPAFTYVGVDYAGPLYIKVSGQSALQKVYVLLFTCCSARAVHLELATDLSVDVFIRCLRRFAARRGLPELIISDNAKTFKAADKILSKLFSYPRVKKFLASKRIDWRFNVDRAPWWGGFFERLIQNTKRCLRKTLRNAKLNYDELHTVLVEVEGTLNSRPLTYVSSDDPEEPLTPSHLMYGRRILSLPEVTGNRQASLDHTVSSEDLPRRRKYLGLLLEHFWRRWSREYVTELRNLHRQKSRPRSSIAVSEGDVVTVFEDNLPRSQWKLGRVEQLIHGADDRVRAAVVKVISKSGRPVTMKRPVQRLFPLEIPVVSNDEQPREEQIIDGIRPPRRLAARNADYIRRLVDQ